MKLVRPDRGTIMGIKITVWLYVYLSPPGFPLAYPVNVLPPISSSYLYPHYRTPIRPNEFHIT